MNKRERVIAAFQGKETDHVPVCMWKHVPAELWDDDDKFIQCQLNSYRVTDVDFVKLSADKYFGWPAPVLEQIASAKALYDIQPLGADHPYIRGQIERTKSAAFGAAIGGRTKNRTAGRSAVCEQIQLSLRANCRVLVRGQIGKNKKRERIAFSFCFGDP